MFGGVTGSALFSRKCKFDGKTWECGWPELDEKLGKQLDLDQAGPPGSLPLSAPSQTLLCPEEARRC